MNELDQALVQCLKGAGDQSVYYELFLNTKFYIPIVEEKDKAKELENGNRATIAPVFLNEGEGKSSILLFDTEERLNSWTNGAVGYTILPGHVIIEMTPEGKFLSLNIGTRYKKEFIPEEIRYLKGVVSRIREAMAKGME